MIIQGGTIHIGDGTVIEDGYIRLVGGKIVEVAPGDYQGEDSQLLDARGKIVTPGFIDAHCHVGMWEEGLDFEGDDGNEVTDPCTPWTGPLRRRWTTASPPSSPAPAAPTR